MLANKRTGRLQLQYQLSVDNQVGKILSKQIPVFIPDLKPLLRLDLVSGFFQSVSQAILVNLFKIAVTQIDMNAIGDLPDIFQQLFYFLHFSTSTRLIYLRACYFT